jgi:hypothetical protein
MVPKTIVPQCIFGVLEEIVAISHDNEVPFSSLFHIYRAQSLFHIHPTTTKVIHTTSDQPHTNSLKSHTTSDRRKLMDRALRNYGSGFWGVANGTMLPWAFTTA